MATYAAYRHVELDKVGCGKRSIMKPPGGDSHDIFGANFHGTPSHHRVLKPPGGGTSGLFDPTPEESEKPRARSTASENLDVQTPNNVLNGNEGKTNGVNNGKSAMTRNCVTGEGCQTTDHYVIRVHRQRDGNPVTGEGYDTPETQAPAPSRARIPPGGYSSGLW